MPFSIGVIGAGQFAGQFTSLFHAHPGVGEIYVTDLLPQRAEALVAEQRLAGTRPDFEAMLASSVDAIAIFTQRWMHGPLVVRALEAGKHVYCAVPMAFTVEEIGGIIEAVKQTGLIYMMGETSYYNPATVYAREKYRNGELGEVFYAEGDYVHDMDLGFYDAYKFSGGPDWKKTASFPPMHYPTHAIGGVLGAIPDHAVSVSCLGVHDKRGDGVFDTSISLFGNDFSNATALFELSGGGSMRTNEFRRVGYPSHRRESRFSFFGTEGSFEELVASAVWQTRDGFEDVSALVATDRTMSVDDPALAGVSPALREVFVSGYAQVHQAERRRLPKEFEGIHNGHEGSHHFLADDFVTAVNNHTLPTVNAWVAARYTLPGIIAHQSALRNGERLPIPDFGDAPGSL